MNKQVLAAFLSAAILTTQTAAIAQSSEPIPSLTQSQQEHLSAVNEEVQTQSLRLMVFSALLSDKLVKMDKVPAQVEQRYQRIKLTYFGSLPTSSASGITVFLAQQTSQRIELFMNFLTTVFRALAEGMKASSTAINDSSTAIYKIPAVKYAVDHLGSGLRYVVEQIVEISRSSVFKGSGMLAGTLSASTVLGGSAYFGAHNASEALTGAKARALLGYDRALQKNIDQVVGEVSGIFSLSAAQAAQFKTALLNETINQAVKNNFSKNSNLYKIDVLQLLLANNLASNEQVVFVKALLPTYELLSQSKAITLESELKDLRSNVDNVAALSAVLAELSNNGQITDPTMKAEIDRILGSVTAKMKLAVGRLQITN